MPTRLPAFLTRVRSAPRPHHHADLWSVAERLDAIGAGDITGYDPEGRLLFTTGLDPLVLERPGRRPLTTEHLEELQDALATLRY